MFGNSFQDIVSDFKKKVCDQISLDEEGLLRYHVNTPFTFDDGDSYVILLKNVEGKWQLSDEGHTLMHLSYWIEGELLEEGRRKELIEGIAESFNLRVSDGQLILGIENELFGDSLFSYIQALVKISDIDFLSVERVKSTFLEDFDRLMAEEFNEKARFNWTDNERDKAGAYSIDCRLDISRIPIFIYAVWSDERALNSTVSIMRHREWGEKFRAIVIHENMEDLNKKNLYRITDAADKQFPSFYGKDENLISYLRSEAESYSS